MGTHPPQTNGRWEPTSESYPVPLHVCHCMHVPTQPIHTHTHTKCYYYDHGDLSKHRMLTSTYCWWMQPHFTFSLMTLDKRKMTDKYNLIILVQTTLQLSIMLGVSLFSDISVWTCVYLVQYFSHSVYHTYIYTWRGRVKLVKLIISNKMLAIEFCPSKVHDELKKEEQAKCHNM